MSRRQPCSLETYGHLSAELESDPRPVRICNISAGGVGLVSRHSIEPGVRLTVGLFNKAKVYFTEVPLRIVYTIRCPGDELLVGACFTRALSEEEAGGLLNTA
jgi:hypothetical protein